MLLALLAYKYRDWRDLSLAITLAGLPFIPFLFMLVESPRWLQSQQRLTEANYVLKLMAEGGWVDL